MKRKVFLGLLALVTLALVGFACGGKEEKAAAPAPAAKAAPAPAAPAPAAPAPAAKVEEAPGVIDIGIMGVAIGFSAAWGVPFETAKVMAADEVNAEGGLLVGGKRYKINVDIQQSKYEVPTMLSITEKWLNQDKIKFIFTNGDPAIGLVDPKSTAAKAIMLSSTWDMVPLKSPYTFGYLSTQKETAPILFRTLQKEQPQVKSYVYVPVNFRYDINAADWTEEWASKLGFTSLGRAFIEGDQVDMTPTANAVLAKRPDAVLLGCIGGNTVPMIRALREGGFKGLITTNWACESTQKLLNTFTGAEAAYLENYYAVDGVVYPLDPDMAALIDVYRGRVVGADATPVVTLDMYYYSMKIMLEGIKAAGTVTDPDAIAKAIEETHIVNKFYPGDPVMTMGGLKKLGQKHQLQEPHAVNVIRGGKITTLSVETATVE